MRKIPALTSYLRTFLVGQDGQQCPCRVTGCAHMGAGHSTVDSVTTPEKQARLAVQLPQVAPLGHRAPDSGSEQDLHTWSHGECGPPSST